MQLLFSTRPFALLSQRIAMDHAMQPPTQKHPIALWLPLQQEERSAINITNSAKIMPISTLVSVFMLGWSVASQSFMFGQSAVPKMKTEENPNINEWYIMGGPLDPTCAPTFLGGPEPYFCCILILRRFGGCSSASTKRFTKLP